MRTLTLAMAVGAVLLWGCQGDKVDELDPDLDGDGYSGSEDCDDADPDVGPGAAEVCDGLDNDCDGEVDEGVLEVFYVDADGDGYGDPESGVEACEVPSGHVESGDDCDDQDVSVSPGAEELCDGQDNDCDGALTDEESDLDGDTVLVCDFDPESWSGDTTITAGGDCDDGDHTVYPEASELCDGQDNDCDGVLLDEESDLDGDTWVACTTDDGGWDGDAVSGGDDCDDTDPSLFPGAPELCDGLINGCGVDLADDEVDDDGDGAVECTFDADGWDGDGAVTAGDDCDDDDLTIYVGADELCDGQDNDCDTVLPDDESDVDGDGVVACAFDEGGWDGDTAIADDEDCDDDEDSVYPAATEVCDGQYNDCDDADYDAAGAPPDETDDDSDAYVE